jgi:hypothetical protein
MRFLQGLELADRRVPENGEGAVPVLVDRVESGSIRDVVRLCLVVAMLSERLVAAVTVLSESLVVVIKVLSERLVVVVTMPVAKVVDGVDVRVLLLSEDPFVEDSVVEERVCDMGTSNGGGSGVGRNSVEEAERTDVSVAV